MANCNKLFCGFNKIITPSQEQLAKMKASREALEKKITTKIKAELDVKVSYFTQGSGARDMKTIIIKDDGTYDADRGVYIPSKPDVKPETVQGYVYEAVNDQTADGAEHRRKCIRVFYKTAYNIDFPVYYETAEQGYSYLAVKGDGWIKDAPAEIIAWFQGYKDDDGQLIRVIKYLKAWASRRSKKMPSGIAFTVWAAKHFVFQKDRDDKCLHELLKTLQNTLSSAVSCIAPVEPYDDLVSKLDDDQKAYFKAELDDFVERSRQALDEPNQLKASKIWIKCFGDRFPEGLDENVDEKESLLRASANIVLAGTANLSKSGIINSNSGISHLPHRNYGG